MDIDVLKLGEVVHETMDKATSIRNADEFPNLRRCEIEVAVPRLDCMISKRKLYGEQNVILTNCFPSALRITSPGTPLN